MRLRLAHQLTLVLTATVLLAVLGMGGLVAWNLRTGFSEYLRAQDAAHLDRLMQSAEADLQRRGGWPREVDPRQLLRQWLGASMPRTEGGPAATPDLPGDEPGADDAAGLRPPPPWRPDGEGESRPPRPLGQRPPPPDQAPAPPPPARDPDRIGARLLLLDAQGRLLAGRRELQGLAVTQSQRRALKLEGRTLATLVLVERQDAPQGVDAGFLQRQYRGIAAIGAALLLLALLLAQLLARRWLRPLQRAQQAARRYAQGDFSLRHGAARADELGALMKDLDAMAEALQRNERDRRRWIAQLSHELRTPLAVLRGELEALADGVRHWDAKALSSLQDEVQRLSRLIEDFHLLSVSDVQRLSCEFSEQPLAELLLQAGARVQERVRAKGLRLDMDLPRGLGAVRWDGERIVQLLGTLLENSLRYTDAPGRIVLSARARGALIEIAVDDTPPGLGEAERRQIFEPLYRAEASRSREKGGSGLGLSIARALAHSHRGRLGAEASPLGGMRLLLTLPRDAEAALTRS